MKRRYPTRSSKISSDGSGMSADSGNQPAKVKRRSASSRKKTKVRPNETGANSTDADASTSSTTENHLEENFSDSMAKPMSTTSKDPKTTVATIEMIPDKVLVEIFEMLSLSTRIRVERVCRRWNILARNYSWSQTKKIDYQVVADGFLGGTFMSLVQSSDVESDSDDEFILNRRISPHLCRAILSRPRLTNDSLRQLLDRAGGYLTVIDLSGYRDVIDYRVLRNIGQQCSNLESVNLTGILVTNTSLLSLATGCRRLKSVNFQRCFHDSIVDRGMSNLLFSCHELTSLNLSENERVNGTCFDQLPPSLRHLDVSACYALKDEAVRAVAERCPALESLHLDCCDRLSFESLAYAFDRLPQLSVLRLSEFYVLADAPSPQAVAAMQSLAKLSNLTSLYLNNNYLIDDTVVCAVARSCPNLETLDISGGNKGLTDHSLISLGRFAYRSLKRLNLNYLTRITNVGVKALATCSTLQTLLLHRCEAVSDDGLVELAKHCHELRHLDVSFCHNITNATVTMFQKERRLRHRKQQGKKRAVTNDAAGRRQGDQEEKHVQRGKFRPPPGGIVMFVGATMVDVTFPTNKFVRLNFRDTISYWPSGPWD